MKRWPGPGVWAVVIGGWALAAGAAQVADPGAALNALMPADILILGEIHDNPTHHANQAAIVAALDPAALVFEMLSADQAARAETGPALDADALGARLGWADSGWPDFSFYFPIFAASEARVYGAAQPRAALNDAVKGGAASVFGPEAARFGLAASLPGAQQDAREAMQKQAHCNALPDVMLPGMVEVQRLRDAALARASLQALADTGGPVVVITGNGHARTDWGVPAALRQAAPDLRVRALGQIEAAQPDPPYDAWLLTDPVARDDPCAAFQDQ